MPASVANADWYVGPTCNRCDATWCAPGPFVSDRLSCPDHLPERCPPTTSFDGDIVGLLGVTGQPDTDIATTITVKKQWIPARILPGIELSSSVDWQRGHFQVSITILSKHVKTARTVSDPQHKGHIAGRPNNTCKQISLISLSHRLWQKNSDNFWLVAVTRRKTETEKIRRYATTVQWRRQGHLTRGRPDLLRPHHAHRSGPSRHHSNYYQ